MLYCYGDDCPIRLDCYRHTQPTRRRDAFGRSPYDHGADTCEYFVTNQPTEEQIRTGAYYIWLREGRPEGRAAAHWAESAAMWRRSMGCAGRDDEHPGP